MPKKIVTGTVVSNKMEKTIVVEVKDIQQHPFYEKRFVRSKKYFAHDENSEAGMGDVVTIEEYRPISRHKRWNLVSIDKKNIL